MRVTSVKPRRCWNCGHTLDADYLNRRLSEKSQNLREALNRARDKGISIGRPREFDYEKAFALRQKGLSYRKIAEELGCSMNVAYRACRMKEKT